MHYLILATLKIPPQEAEPQTDQKVQEQIAELENEKQNWDSPRLADILIGKLNSLRSSFSRAVISEAAQVMERYSMSTQNPDYLEFCDRTASVTQEYSTGTVDCFRLADGCIVPSFDDRVFMRFVIRDGKVYKCRSGSLQHEKRSKQAKRMKALPEYPLRKLFPSLESYAKKRYGYTFDKGQGGYGFYYNPDAMWDWYSVGGRWPELFLVKETCPEYSIGASRTCAPKGYQWAFAARKKDIEWQVLSDWMLMEAKEHFKSLKKLFATGQRDKDIYGEVTEDGILYRGELIYQKDECEESHLMRRGLLDDRRYPVCFYGYLDDAGCQTEHSFRSHIPSDGADSQKKWLDIVHDYIDSLSDDDVLVGIDCHC
ncbi:MAG: hypothetical protein NC541_04585 [bacterium]|nr:hypothetical protein [bacterium]